MNIAVFLFEIPIMCLICLSPPNQVLQRQFILILFVVCKNLGRAWSKSHKINHPQLIQLVMLGVASEYHYRYAVTTLSDSGDNGDVTLDIVVSIRNFQSFIYYWILIMVHCVCCP